MLIGRFYYLWAEPGWLSPHFLSLYWAKLPITLRKKVGKKVGQFLKIFVFFIFFCSNYTTFIVSKQLSVEESLFTVTNWTELFAPFLSFLIESDMMRSISGVSVQKPNIHQNLQDAVVLKTEQQSDHNTLTNTVSKEANLNAGLLSHRPSRMSSSERTKVSNPKVHLQQHIHFLKIKEQTTHKARLQKASEGPETVRHSSREGTEKVDKVTPMFISKAPVSTTVSSTLSIMSGTEKSTASLNPFLIAHTPTITAVTKTYPHLPWTQEPTETLISLTLSTSSSSSAPASSPISLSSPLANFSALGSSSPSSSMKTRLSHVTPPSNTTSVPPLLSRSLLRRPVCLYPPVPTHGTFYFRNVENPGPREYRHYIQYTCYTGYTLAHGDIHSYCQQDGTWSGVTPVCLGRLLLLLLLKFFSYESFSTEFINYQLTYSWTYSWISK